MNIVFSPILLSGASLMVKPYILYFPFLYLLCLLKMIFMRLNQRTMSMMDVYETSFVSAINDSLHLRLRKTLLTQRKISHILHQNSTKWALSHILKFFSTEISWTRSTQFQSHTATKYSIFLLGYPIKPYLRPINAVQIQSPQIHILPNKSMFRPITAITQSLVPTSVLVRVYLLWTDTMTKAIFLGQQLVGAGLQV